MLGNLDAARDWGHSKDYVYCMWLMLQHDEPDDFVCSTGISHTVQHLVEYVFGKLDLNWKEYVKQNEKFMRPEELDVLKGDCSKAKETLGWKHEYTFETMLDEMIEYWMEELG
jgi:GDPmannose 4,6-dehydratase